MQASLQFATATPTKAAGAGAGAGVGAGDAAATSRGGQGSFRDYVRGKAALYSTELAYRLRAIKGKQDSAWRHSDWPHPSEWTLEDCWDKWPDLQNNLRVAQLVMDEHAQYDLLDKWKDRQEALRQDLEEVPCAPVSCIAQRRRFLICASHASASPPVQACVDPAPPSDIKAALAAVDAELAKAQHSVDAATSNLNFLKARVQQYARCSVQHLY